MSATDPFTGAPIPPNTPTVRCGHGHLNRQDSWQQSGRCNYPGCGYSGAPIPVSGLPIRVVSRRPIRRPIQSASSPPARNTWMVPVINEPIELPPSQALIFAIVLINTFPTVLFFALLLLLTSTVQLSFIGILIIATIATLLSSVVITTIWNKILN